MGVAVNGMGVAVNGMGVALANGLGWQLVNVMDW